MHPNNLPHIPTTQYAKVNNDNKIPETREEGQKPGVWTLNINDFNLKSIEPHKYYLTTGDAIIKTSVLEKDLFRAAIMARKLKNILTKLKDKAERLETKWEDGNLILMKKDCRKKKPDDINKQ
jgi:hypothetical protein